MSQIKQCRAFWLAAGLLTGILLLSACAPAVIPQPMPDMQAALTQAVATILAGGTQTAQYLPPTAAPTSTPTPAPTAVRTPPALPGPYTGSLLNPLDVPHTYIADTCQVLKARWAPANAVPGTVVMPIMFHSITKGEVSPGNYNAISMQDFRKLMDDLHEMGFEAITMQQAADFLYNNARIPKRSVILIVDDRKYRAYFDDTFKTYYDKWGWKVVNSWITLDDSIGALALPDNIALEAEGWVDHQSHGYIHNIGMNDDSSPDFLKGELLGSMERIQAAFNKTPIAIIWPTGTFGTKPVEAARQYGYKLGFTINPRGPIMFNWVPLAAAADPMRPSYIPDGPIGDPLMTLPRYWDTDARAHLDTVRNVSDEAAAYAEQNKAVELEYYDILCAPEYGALAQP